MKRDGIRDILRATPKGLQLTDERGRRMDFPRRRDYVTQLQEHGVIGSEQDFVADDSLTEAVYLDWLRRPQVGCVFAQLLARPRRRMSMRTAVVRSSSGLVDPSQLADHVASVVEESVGDPSAEALSVLLPQIRDRELLARFAWELGTRPSWTVEQEHLWRGTLVLVGLRVAIAADVVAETLGMGPFSIFPRTRQCPITTLEVRTKTTRAKRSKHSSDHSAAHLADLPTEHMLTRNQHGVCFKVFTPRLKERILEGVADSRAKAGVTYSVPAAVWASLKTTAS